MTEGKAMYLLKYCHHPFGALYNGASIQMPNTSKKNRQGLCEAELQPSSLIYDEIHWKYANYDLKYQVNY